MAAARFLTSPCLPFCIGSELVSDFLLLVVEQIVGSVAWCVLIGVIRAGIRYNAPPTWQI